MTTPMRAFIVCVNYADLLAITLPYNRHHFSEVIAVTSSADTQTQAISRQNSAHCFVTEVFYEGGAEFNKFAALEQAFDEYGRDGWICIMDADVMWPKHIDWEFWTPDTELESGRSKLMLPGNLYTPLRRMCLDIQNVPQEPYWPSYAHHPQQVEWAGYTQIFYGNDWHLGQPPWHQTNWKHAGGPDSWFQQKWPAHCKHRPPFECLHLGPAGQNWCGRTTAYTDGSLPSEAVERLERLKHYMTERKRRRDFESEKL